MKTLIAAALLVAAAPAGAVVLCAPLRGGPIVVRPEACRRHEYANPGAGRGWWCAKFERLDKPFGSLVRFKAGCDSQEQSLNASDETCYPAKLGRGRLLKARDATSGGCEDWEVQFYRGQCDETGVCS